MEYPNLGTLILFLNATKLDMIMKSFALLLKPCHFLYFVKIGRYENPFSIKVVKLLRMWVKQAASLEILLRFECNWNVCICMSIFNTSPLSFGARKHIFKFLKSGFLWQHCHMSLFLIWRLWGAQWFRIKLAISGSAVRNQGVSNKIYMCNQILLVPHKFEDADDKYHDA